MFSTAIISNIIIYMLVNVKEIILMKKGKLLLLVAASATLIATLIKDKKNNEVENGSFEVETNLDLTEDEQ
jgi:hypothetical protein